MKDEVCIFNLRGNFAAIREYAKTIASMSASASNAYVMAFDKDNEILWVIQAGDDLDEVKAAIDWRGVRRVEIYDHSADGQYKTEQVYVTSQKSLDAYTSERSADEYDVTSNRTAWTADNWQASETAQQDNTNEDNEGTEAPAEPSRLAQTAAKVVAKVAETAKTFAHRAAFILSLAAVALLSFAVVPVCGMAFASILDAAGIEGGARFALCLAAIIPAVDIALWIEANALAVVARLFPGMFTGRRPEFLAPGSFFWAVYRENIA